MPQRPSSCLIRWGSIIIVACDFGIIFSILSTVIACYTLFAFVTASCTYVPNMLCIGIYSLHEDQVTSELRAKRKGEWEPSELLVMNSVCILYFTELL